MKKKKISEEKKFKKRQYKVETVRKKTEIARQSVMWFQSIGKSAAVDKTASDFDNTNLKIKKLQGLLTAGFTMHILPATSQGPWTWFFKK